MNPLIDILNEYEFAIPEDRLRAAALATLKHHDVPTDVVITIVFMTDDEIHGMNLKHRGVDKPTDVLSFPASALPEEIDDSPYLGDILIAYAYTKAQSEREGTAADDGFMLMVVHGTLHLLGYDHATTEERAEMWDMQALILREMGISPSIVPVYVDDDDA